MHIYRQPNSYECQARSTCSHMGVPATAVPQLLVHRVMGTCLSSGFPPYI